MTAASPVTQSKGYRIDEVLGSGGFGTVYRATRLGASGFQKEAALKVLERGALEEDTRRLFDEARMLGRLRHRAIPVVDGLVQVENGRWGLVMELVPGVALGSVMRSGPVPVGASLSIGVEVASALAAAERAAALGILEDVAYSRGGHAGLAADLANPPSLASDGGWPEPA